MVECTYCNAETHTELPHAPCEGERDRRAEAGVCIYCGERRVVEYSLLTACSRCSRQIHSPQFLYHPPYLGYPPGGQ